MSRTTAPQPTDQMWASAEQAPPATLRPLWQRLSVFLAARWAEVSARQHLRRAERELGRLDNRMLRDIGLTRSEIGSFVRHGRGSRPPLAKDGWQ